MPALSKLVRHAKKHESVFHTQENRQSIDIVSDWAQMLAFSDKDLKANHNALELKEAMFKN